MTLKELTQAELVEDFKQYVTVVVTTVVKESESRLRSEIRELRQDVESGFAAIGDTFENHQKQLDKHDNVIKRLQAMAAR